jgi:hypothetical protein
MSKGRLVVENGFGRVFAFAVGGGEALLVLESDGEALTVGLAPPEAIQLAAYLSEVAGDHEALQQPTVVHQPAQPSGLTALPASREEPTLHQVAAAFNSVAGANHKPGGRTRYVAEHLGISANRAYYLVHKAREAGLTATIRKV